MTETTPSQIVGNDPISESPIQSETVNPPPINPPNFHDISTISILRQFELYTSPQMSEVSDLIVNGGEREFRTRLNKFKEEAAGGKLSKATEVSEHSNEAASVDASDASKEDPSEDPSENPSQESNEDSNTNATKDSTDPNDSKDPQNYTDPLDSKDTKNSTDPTDPTTKFWYNLLDNVPTSTSDLENHLIQGIPANLRCFVYLKTLQVRYKFNSREGYANLVKKASKQLDDPKEVLNVFKYYCSDESSENSTFVLDIFNIISAIHGLLKEDQLFLLFKFNKLITNFNKEEFFYKVSRSLEDFHSDIFNHITLQGIQFDTLYKKYVYTFFEKIDSEKVTILDFLVFEGFDFILRLILYLFNENKEFILQLEGLELIAYLNSKEFFEVDFNWQRIISQSSQIITYENEYHLIHANSLSNNNNELKNLQDTNVGLKTSLSQLTAQLQNLQSTHDEILQQNDDFILKLNQALEQNNNLSTLKDELLEKYENLTMKENLKNTIKANKEFSERNMELETQINELKKGIAEKRLRVEKVKTV